MKIIFEMQGTKRKARGSMLKTFENDRHPSNLGPRASHNAHREKGRAKDGFFLGRNSGIGKDLLEQAF